MPLELASAAVSKQSEQIKQSGPKFRTVLLDKLWYLETKGSLYSNTLTSWWIHLALPLGGCFVEDQEEQIRV